MTRRKIRAVALTAASRLAQGNGLSTTLTENVLRTAKQYEAWMLEAPRDSADDDEDDDE